ncbi:MAG: Protein translocase subunit SecE [Verrucomicrobiales bacterium]|nr:Protein translocase subunit SecE [Verrucomicrobiales bacterium]
MLVGLVVAAVVFVVLVRRGSFLRISGYFRETQEELKRCSWPTVEELKASTGVVFVAIVLIGVFTIVTDFAFSFIIRHFFT